MPNIKTETFMYEIGQASAMRQLRGNLDLRLLGKAVLMLALIFALLAQTSAHAAINQVPIPGPQTNTYGLEATKTQPPPTTPPTISTPGSGGSYSTSPITVSGVCKDGLLVQIYNNGTFVGAVDCKGGSFTIQVSLYTGQNDLTAIQYDDLDQASPISNMVSVTFNNGTAASSFGSPMTLTSNYGRRAANPNAVLSWPLILSGGTGPYAFSIDWGDGTSPQLKSQALSGAIDINHTYKQSGLYHVTIKVTDVNGQTAFLQLVAIANGTPKATAADNSDKNSTVYVNKILWVPLGVLLALVPLTYWLGRRSMVVSLHRKLEKDMANYKEL
jgi:hypothetical protein